MITQASSQLAPAVALVQLHHEYPDLPDADWYIPADAPVLRGFLKEDHEPFRSLSAYADILGGSITPGADYQHDGRTLRPHRLTAVWRDVQITVSVSVPVVVQPAALVRGADGSRWRREGSDPITGEACYVLDGTVAPVPGMVMIREGELREAVGDLTGCEPTDEPVPYVLTNRGAVAAGWDSMLNAHYIHPDVGEDSPAALLALRLRQSQPDVTATEVHGPTSLSVTVRPQSLDCWNWWMARFAVSPETVTHQGTVTTGQGQHRDVTVHLAGSGIPQMLAPAATAARSEQ
ncbi:hypothetical protein QFW82_23510 [Streptomyces malaysiensis subsp. malaysiensis]|uniref:hypothetical protein n=1 Tax=Streptomyces malaysiensis TaxID=92644 RepID=UPI0024BF1404|nr:hypothetical protein [Streptomyces sp. NA07423]WHX19799.1 hypothetical protein QFW82_23510 [Streptomyces sp. NA07423]